MTKINKIVTAAMTTLLSLTTASALADTAASSATDNMEKCFGIVKAGMNDCATATAGCASSATKNRQADAFIFLPKGICNRIDGGKLTAPTAKKVAK